MTADTSIKERFTVSTHLYDALRACAGRGYQVLGRPVEPKELLIDLLERYLRTCPREALTLVDWPMSCPIKPRRAGEVMTLRSLEISLCYIPKYFEIPTHLLVSLRERSGVERDILGRAVTLSELLERALKAYLHKPGGTQPASRSDSPVDTPSTQNN